MSDDKKVITTIPLWLAVPITVLLAMPFGLWLGRYNFPLWCAFIVWAEYFALGGKPAVLKVILPSFAYGATATAVVLFLIPFFSFLPSVVVPGDLATSLILAIGVGLMVYSMNGWKTLQVGSLPLFNGITMALAINFTGSYPDIVSGPVVPLWAGVWTVLMGAFGGLLGAFNVWLTFPKEAPASSPTIPATT